MSFTVNICVLKVIRVRDEGEMSMMLDKLSMQNGETS